jgi:ribosomal subunit interface protein
MKITIESVGLALTGPLETYIEKKFATLQKFVARFEEGGECAVRVEVMRTTRHHRKGEVYQATAALNLPKKNLRVEELADDVRTAIDRAKDVLRSEIEKYKEKTTTPAKVREGK